MKQEAVVVFAGQRVERVGAPGAARGGDDAVAAGQQEPRGLEADPSFVDAKIDWSAVPVRCRVVEVTADPTSRRITLE